MNKSTRVTDVILGRGTGHPGGQMMMVPDDDDIDKMNDETFGDSAVDVGGGGWTSTDNYNELIEYAVRHGSSLRHEPMFAMDSRGDSPLGQELMELSINQLVLDDELDDPAILSSSRSHIKQQSYNTGPHYAGTTPPPVMDLDNLVSPTKQSIWSVSDLERQLMSQHEAEQGLRTVLEGLKSPEVEDQSIVSAGPATQDVEHSLYNDLKRNIQNRSTSPQPTLLLPSYQPSPSYQSPTHQPPATLILIPSPVNPITAREEARRVATSIYQQKQHHVPPPPGLPPPGLPPPERSPHQFLPRVPQQPYQPIDRTPPYPGLQHPGAIRGPGPVRGGGRISPNPSFPPRHMGAGDFGGGGFNGRGVTRVGGRFYQQPMPGYFSPNNHTNLTHMNQPSQGGWGDGPGPRTMREPPEEGLMTHKEKEWVIKIQMLQLQSNNPYVDDFYYQTFMLRKMTSKQLKGDLFDSDDEGEKLREPPRLLIPQTRHVEHKPYAPTQYKGSLGRVTCASVSNPRQMIDVSTMSIYNTDEEETSRLPAASRDCRKYRQYLLKIEKAFDVLLDVIDVEKKVLALPEEDRDMLYDSRRYMINSIFTNLGLSHTDLSKQRSPHETFNITMGVRKGKKLLSRLLPLLNKAQSESLVLSVLRNLPYTMKRDRDDDVLPSMYQSVSRVIQASSFDTLTLYMSALLHATVIVHSKEPHTAVTMALKNKFGLSVLCSLLSHGEIIYTTLSLEDLNSESQHTWTQAVCQVAQDLVLVKEADIAIPVAANPGVLEHFKRFISHDTLSQIEPKIKKIHSCNVER